VSEPHTDDLRSLLEGIQLLYTDLALHPEKDFGWGKGKESARQLGYDARWLDNFPDSVWQSAAPVGNPFDLGPIMPGETVVDLGCGAGIDLCIAALLIGDSGHAIGIDITPAMVEKAKENARLLGLSNVEVYVGDIADIPLEDVCADVVISNGVINLSAHKPCVFKEVLRLLKLGGRFQFADMVRDGAGTTPGCGSWADCVSGTVDLQQYLEMLSAFGFLDAEFVSYIGYRTAPTTIGATFRARKP
jgi:arsenite methyltransferase